MKISSDEIISWLALYLVPGLGNRTFRHLLREFGSPKAVFEAGFSGLSKVKGVRKDIIRRIVNRQFSSDPEKEMKMVEKCNARIIRYIDPSYPELLKEIHSPPMLLYARGKDIPVKQMPIAVIGSRNPSHYGIKAAGKISFGLAGRGVCVVSGMAKGIDSAAHRACLQGKGFTIAVIGTGIDRVYPAQNKNLFEEIAEKGIVLSEFPTGSPPEAKNFPIRNRIISGLSRGVAVIEATRKSGSLITASLALEQGREVFAVPGSIDSFKSIGTHFLIKQGAGLIENADDILDAFNFSSYPVQQKCDFGDTVVPVPELSKSEKMIYDVIGDYPIHIDKIVRMVEMDAGAVSSILMELELKGVARQLIGKMFVR